MEETKMLRVSAVLAVLILAVALAGCSGAGSENGDPTVIPFPPPDGHLPVISLEEAAQGGSVGARMLAPGKVANYPAPLSARTEGEKFSNPVDTPEVAVKGGNLGIFAPRMRRSDAFINVGEQQVWRVNMIGSGRWKVWTPGVIELRPSSNGRTAFVRGLHRGWTKVTLTNPARDRFEIFVQVFGKNDYLGVQIPERRGAYDAYVAGTQEWCIAMGLQSPPEIEGSNDFIPSSWLTSDVRVNTIPTGVVKFESSDISGFRWTVKALRDGECDVVIRLYDRIFVAHVVAKFINPDGMAICLGTSGTPEIAPDGNWLLRIPVGLTRVVGVSWFYYGQSGVPDVTPVYNTSPGLNWDYYDGRKNYVALSPKRAGDFIATINVAGKVKLIHVIGT